VSANFFQTRTVHSVLIYIVKLIFAKFAFIDQNKLQDNLFQICNFDQMEVVKHSSFRFENLLLADFVF